MKRIISVILAVIVGITFSYARKQVVTYGPLLCTPYMSIEGVFEGKTLADGEVLMRMNNITLEGTYSKGVFSGVMHYHKDGNIVFSINCDGPISNTYNGTIAKRRHTWKFNLTTKVVASFKNEYDKTPATGSLEIDTAPIKVEHSSNLGYYIPDVYGDFVSKIESQLSDIMTDISIGRYSGTITFANGFKYEGSLICDKNSLSISPSTKAKLIWPNGDVFQGEVNNYNYSTSVYEGYPIVPKSGTITTHKGKVYDFDKWSYPSSDMFVLAENHLPISPSAWEEKRQERLERERQQEEEKRLQKEREEEEKRLQKEREKEARRQELISKYGRKYGESIFNKEPMLGMTIEMIQEIHGSKGSISRHLNYNDEEITTISYGGVYILFGWTTYYKYTFKNNRLIEWEMR